MTRRERLQLIDAVLDQINTIIGEARATTIATTAADQSLRTGAAASIRDLVDHLDAAYSANRTAYESAERAIVAAMHTHALTTGLLRQLMDDDGGAA